MCDPDGSPEGVIENDLERAQRRKREEDELRSEGKPTLHVKFGDKLRAMFPEAVAQPTVEKPVPRKRRMIRRHCA